MRRTHEDRRTICRSAVGLLPLMAAVAMVAGAVPPVAAAQPTSRTQLTPAQAQGPSTIAVFRPSEGKWYFRGLGTVSYGLNGDIPEPRDYNNDGRIDLAVFRPSEGKWYIRGAVPISYGLKGDIPIPRDYNGDRRIDLAVWRPSNGTWYLRGLATVQWGLPGDIPVSTPPQVAL
ncbi:MAG: FG-GAP repeat domain-containing protein [Mycobacteriales bacterium]